MRWSHRGMLAAILASWIVSFISAAALASEWDTPPGLSNGNAVANAPSDPAPTDVSELTMTVGTGVVIDCPEGISRLAASSPEIVDAVTASTKEVLFHAKGLGRATMVVWSKTNRRKTYNVTVEPNLEPLRRLLRETFPEEQMDVVATKESLRWWAAPVLR